MDIDLGKLCVKSQLTALIAMILKQFNVTCPGVAKVSIFLSVRSSTPKNETSYLLNEFCYQTSASKI